jgi:uncharacterized iron-regulated protein
MHSEGLFEDELLNETLEESFDNGWAKGKKWGEQQVRARYAALVAAAREVDRADAALVEANETGDDDDLDETSARFEEAMDALRAALEDKP